jgi:pSer/pThr/pTyr-binding forkhead associated (FHA) protein
MLKQSVGERVERGRIKTIPAIIVAISVVMLCGWPFAPQVNAQEKTGAEQWARSVVLIRDVVTGKCIFNGKVYSVNAGGRGTGFFIDSTGYIMTNAHVVDISHGGTEKAKQQLILNFLKYIAGELKVTDEAQLNSILQQTQLQDIQQFHQVIFPDGSKYDFEVKAFGNPINKESSKDVAVIKINYSNAPILKLGDSEKINILDKVTLIGHSGLSRSSLLDDKSSLKPSIRRGEIAQKRTEADGLPILEININSWHGDSGGPVIDEQGEVVGLLTFGGDGEGQNTGFAVPSNTAKGFISEAGINKNDSGGPSFIPSASSWKFIVIAGVAVAVVLAVMVMGLVFGVAWHKQNRKPAPVEAKAKAILYGVSGHYAGSEIELDGQPLVVGRDPRACQLVFPKSVNGISSRHCLLRLDPQQRVVTIEDCQSTNGTFLQSGEQVSSGRPLTLRSGDRFYLSDPENLFEVRLVGGGLPSPSPHRDFVSPLQNARVAVLQGKTGEFAGKRVELNGAPIVIGRDPQQCQLTFPRSIGDISKRHCTLRYEAANRAFLLEDCGSINGTFVMSNGKGERLVSGQSRRLKSGDQFYLSGPEHLFTVHEEPRS